MKRRLVAAWVWLLRPFMYPVIEAFVREQLDEFRRELDELDEDDNR